MQIHFEICNHTVSDTSAFLTWSIIKNKHTHISTCKYNVIAFYMYLKYANLK
jgi:hypothetical protein